MRSNRSDQVPDVVKAGAQWPGWEDLVQALGQPGGLAVRAAVAAGLEAVVVDDRDGGLGVLLRLPARACSRVCVIGFTLAY